jgi:hypothetical protein
VRSIRKLSLLAAVVAVAIAVVVPAGASAANHKLTHPNGEGLAVGEKFMLKSTNLSIMRSGAWSKCAAAAMPGRVTTNWAESATGKGEGAGSASTCTYNGETAATTVELTELQFTGTKTGTQGAKIGTISLKIVQQRPWGLCELEGSMPFSYYPLTSGFNVYGTFQKEKACLGNQLAASFTIETKPWSGQPTPIIIN